MLCLRDSQLSWGRLRGLPPPGVIAFERIRLNGSDPRLTR